MKKIIGILVLSLILVCFVSCDINFGYGNNGGDNQEQTNNGEGNNSGGVIGGWGDSNNGNSGSNDGNGSTDIGDEKPSPVYPEGELEIFNALFDETSHVSIKLDIPDSELQKIQEDYEKYSSRGSKSPIYRKADMVITITTADGSVGEWKICEVGVRMKGNMSRTSFYNQDDGMYKLVHFKVSFQETFDEAEYYGDEAKVWADSAERKARKNRTFATLEKIDLKWNRNDDTTYIRESYAYEVYREFGVLAPHTTLTSVDIGNDHAGVWVLYEPIDKIFLEKNLPESALGGDLYKLGWTNVGATFTSFSSYGVEDEDKGEFFVYDLKTNKKTSNHESLENLINTINSSSISKEKFASVVDIESFMNYCAVSYMVGNCDDLRNNYNNTYIYFRADTGKMLLIPYDMDRGLGINTWNPYKHGMTKDDPFASYNVLGEQQNPLFLKTICGGGMFVNEYIEALVKVDFGERLTNDRFNESFEIAKALYSDDTTPSKDYRNAGGFNFCFDLYKTCSILDSGNMSFAGYMYAKRQTLYNKIGDLGNNDSSNPDVEEGGSSGNPIDSSDFYIRADFTNWDVDENYKLTDNGDGTFSITISKNQGVKVKVYDNQNGNWYGSEVVDPNCTVWYSTDGHTNINLDSGSYTITINTANGKIYIEKH